MVSRISNVGIPSAVLRCFRLGFLRPSKACHINYSKSGHPKLRNLDHVRQLLSAHEEKAGKPVVLFVEQKDFPESFRFLKPGKDTNERDKEGYKNFSEFIKIIGFTETVCELQINRDNKPKSPEDHGQCTHIETYGFAVRKDRDTIKNAVADSFGTDELKAFLGNFYEHAGRIIILGLGLITPSGQKGSILEYKDILFNLAQRLADDHTEEPSSAS